ncbi:hypothetical protein O3M35_000629 [Rhynocoris fuscipes]|uniref:Fibronectin type-III domain-containing protein n=1 Tax=Rhynocoris fuscipes TaxID=488301 RepID=A0AAW1DPN1_9HEMI
MSAEVQRKQSLAGILLQCLTFCTNPWKSNKDVAYRQDAAYIQGRCKTCSYAVDPNGASRCTRCYAIKQPVAAVRCNTCGDKKEKCNCCRKKKKKMTGRANKEKCIDKSKMINAEVRSLSGRSTCSRRSVQSACSRKSIASLRSNYSRKSCCSNKSAARSCDDVSRKTKKNVAISPAEVSVINDGTEECIKRCTSWRKGDPSLCDWKAKPAGNTEVSLCSVNTKISKHSVTSKTSCRSKFSAGKLSRDSAGQCSISKCGRKTKLSHFGNETRPQGPLRPSNITTNSVDLDWMRPPPPAPIPEYYDVEKQMNKGEWIKVCELVCHTDEMKTTVRGLEPGTSYMFRVTAVQKDDCRGLPLYTDEPICTLTVTERYYASSYCTAKTVVTDIG